MSWLVVLFVLAKFIVVCVRSCYHCGQFCRCIVSYVSKEVSTWRTQLNKRGYQWVRYLTATQTACLDKERKQNCHYYRQGGHYYWY